MTRGSTPGDQRDPSAPQGESAARGDERSAGEALPPGAGVQSDPASTPPETAVRTVVGRPRPRRRPSDAPSEAASRPSESGDTGSHASEAALNQLVTGEEASRAHGFSGLAALLSLGVALALPMVEGTTGDKLVGIITLCLMAIVSGWVYYRTRDGTGYTPTLHAVFGGSLFLGLMIFSYFAGYLSPAPVVLTLGVYYFGQSSLSRRASWLPAGAIVVYATTAFLVTVGVIRDRGSFNSERVDLFTRLFALVAVTCVMGVTLLMARVARSSLREAITRSNRALLVAQQRQAQLLEANQHLARALRVSVGKPGRYTGRLCGPYRLGDIIGLGAIGEVYRAVHEENEDAVAVKVLQVEALARDHLRERFRREASLSSGLESPNIVRVLDIGELEEGTPFMVMELLEGRVLSSRLREEGHIALDEARELAAQLGRGLTDAHRAGVVHRDLKPLNIFETQFAGQRVWKILDFGISKLASSSSTLTRDAVVGTPGYMSPEQARGADVDERSDVFSMAVVLYRALAGRPAFPGRETPQVLFDIVYKTPTRPSALRPQLPRDVDRVLALGLAKDPGLRFQGADELARAFGTACQQGLDRGLRERADAVVRRYPWGMEASPEG